VCRLLFDPSESANRGARPRRGACRERARSAARRRDRQSALRSGPRAEPGQHVEPNRVPSWSRLLIRARRSTETRMNGGRSDADVNALAVMPWTLSPERVLTTVTPVANIPSVRRNAIAGSPSSPAPSSSASLAGASSKGAPKASGAEIALSIATSNSRGAPEPSIRTDSDGHANGPPPPPFATRMAPAYAGCSSCSRSAATFGSGIVGVSSRQCGVSLSCTIRRNRKRSSEMTRTLKPMIFSLSPP
jgi:hypothetical protein